LLLATDLWVSALIRRAQLAGAFATVARKGDARAGAVLVKLYNPLTREVRLYSQASTGEDEAIWMEPKPGAAEPDLDAYVARLAQYDPDLWLVEIEDREGRDFLTEKKETR
jgi:hypothetical protein